METTQQGFTMVELVAVISVAGILMAIGLPSYKYVTTANRVSSAVNGMVGDLQFARAEAIKEGLTVTVCATTDGTTCTGAGSTWTQGWLVFMDGNGNGAIDGNDVTLRMQKPLPGHDTFSADSSVTAVTFNRDGFAQGLPAGGLTLKLHDSTNNKGYTRCLALTIVGAMSSQVWGQGNCT